MNLNPVSGRSSNLAIRTVAFFPALLFTLPALAESFALPSCPFPDVLQDQKSLLIDCSQPDPDAAINQPADSSTQPPVPTDQDQPTLDKTEAENTAQNPDDPGLPPPPPVTKFPPAVMVELKVFGNTVFTPTELQELLNPSKGKSATRQEVCQAADTVTKAYRDRGYILAQAFPLIDRATESLISKGTVRFLAIEGCLEKIDIVGSQRLKPSYINSRLVPGATTPFNANKINDVLALIQTDPKVGKLEVLGITPGASFGGSALSLRVTDGNFFTGFVGADSYVSPFFGGTRVIGGLTYRSITGNSDDLNATYFRSTTGEVDGLDFSYQLPLNPMNGQIQLRYAPTNSRLSLQPGNQRFTSDSYTAEINYRQPLIRTSKNEFALSLGLVMQDEKAALDGAPINITGAADSQGSTRTRVVKFAQEYSSSDDGGNWTMRSQFNLGLGTLGATVNPEPAIDGQFFSWQAQVQRVQRLGQDNYAILLAETQLTPDRLIPNQKFIVGGGQSIRGFRQNVRSGDNGIRLSIEDRFIVGRNHVGQANLQLAANVDAAQLWNSSGPSIADGFLASVGAGVIWEPLPRLVTRLDYAIPLKRLSDAGSSFQDSGLSFSIGYGF
jgi:hemolysin activation/secretion protein